MKIKKMFVVVSMALASLAASSANAAVFNLSGLDNGPIANPGSFTTFLDSPVADSNAILDLVLTGYLSLDGHNSYEDIFTLTINGTPFSGSFDLGGGGTSDSTIGGGSSASTVSASFLGGETTITGLKFNLLSGINSFKFAYTAPGTSNWNGQSFGQGLGDEGWGIKSASVTAVPEPETYGMMLMGLGLIGFVAGRRKNKQA